MAVPIDPTPPSIVTQALRRAGRVNPTATQIAEALTEALQEVKADIMLKAPTHPALQTTSTTTTTRGQQRYALPADSNEQMSISLLDGPDEWRGTMQAATLNTITLDAALTSTEENIVGKYLLMTGGSGIEQYRQIIGYDAGTKVAQLDADWVVLPDTGSTYLIVLENLKIWPRDVSSEFDAITMPTTLGRPLLAATHNLEFLLYPVPDKSTYGLMNRYWVDLSSLDEASPLFTQLLKEWRSIWIQGVAVKTMQRFDEDRYQFELGVYDTMLNLLQSQACGVTPARFFNA